MTKLTAEEEQSPAGVERTYGDLRRGDIFTFNNADISEDLCIALAPAGQPPTAHCRLTGGNAGGDPVTAPNDLNTPVFVPASAKIVVDW